jgi:transcriptional regulator with XRE-family HTH domain
MPEPAYQITAKLIKEIRIEAGLKQAELASMLDVTQSVVSKYEAAERRVDVVELRAICAACGLSLVEFVKRLESRLSGRRDAR